MRRSRPRYGRILFFTTSLTLTLTAAGAATGFVPYRAEAPVLPAADAAEDETVTDAVTDDTVPASDSDDDGLAPTRSVDLPLRSISNRAAAERAEHGDPSNAPRRSGDGRRVVYDMSDQRVWLIGPKDGVKRSYLVSGSVYDNLGPGRYDVYSRSRWAVSFDGQSTMEYFVRFTEGDNAAIGFHDIPEDSNGDEVQTAAQLGTPRSHGCIRQRLVDAKAMWRFAHIGTSVSVLA
jgi:L,D-transpeptidase-like protein